MSSPDAEPKPKGSLSQKVKNAFSKLTPGKKSDDTAAAQTATTPSQEPSSGPTDLGAETNVTPPIPKDCTMREAALNGILYTACKHGDLTVVEATLRNPQGSNLHTIVNLQNHSWRTPLMIACLNGHHDVAEKLLDHGASPHLTGGENKTALDFAQERKDPRIVELLETRLEALKELQPDLVLPDGKFKKELAPMAKNVAADFEERKQREAARNKRVADHYGTTTASPRSPRASAPSSYVAPAQQYAPRPAYKPVTRVMTATQVVTRTSSYPEAKILAQYPGVNERGAVGWRPGDTHSTSSMYRPRVQGKPVKSLASYPSMGSKW